MSQNRLYCLWRYTSSSHFRCAGMPAGMGRYPLNSQFIHELGKTTPDIAVIQSGTSPGRNQHGSSDRQPLGNDIVDHLRKWDHSSLACCGFFAADCIPFLQVHIGSWQSQKFIDTHTGTSQHHSYLSYQAIWSRSTGYLPDGLLLFSGEHPLLWSRFLWKLHECGIVLVDKIPLQRVRAQLRKQPLLLTA